MDQSAGSGRGYVSVLHSFPPSVGRDVTVAVVKPLLAGLGNPDTHSLLHTDRQVKWTMEVLSYGLTMPLDSGDTVKLCVKVYCDWLAALVSHRESVPRPISREPNHYGQKILRQLYSLFWHRSDQVHLSIYQQVLCSVQSVCRNSASINRETWECLLHFLLRINHSLLTPPTNTDLSHLSMSVLLEVLLLSCSRCFPSGSLWQTVRQVMNSWTPQMAVVEQWSRVMEALTSRLLQVTFGPSFPPLMLSDADCDLVPSDLNKQRVSHTWFRFLHLLSDPVAFRSPDSQDVFSRTMRTVSRLADAFLGISVANEEPTEHSLPLTGQTSRTQFRDRLPSLGVAVTRSPFKDRLPPYGFSRPRSGSAPPTPMTLLSVPSTSPASSHSPPPQRRPVNKPNNTISSSSQWKFSVTPAPQMLSPAHTNTNLQLKPAHYPLSPARLRCTTDSLLHLFGSWLFDAALVHKQPETPIDMNGGRAEACGALCRIFSCKKSKEEIQPVYLARFYFVLLEALSVEASCAPVVAAILLNSASLFCCDLKGINILLLPFLTAVEEVLKDRECSRFHSFVDPSDLRRSAILILLSVIPLPLHFPHIQSQDVRLDSVLIGALQTETDATNTQLLLGAMLNLVQESTLLEAESQQETSSHFGETRRSRTHTRSSEPPKVMWVRFVRVLTQRLSAQWKNDSAVCLSALEALRGLAKVYVQVDETESRRVLSSVCGCIMFQCSRPPQLHSRELHSIIVSAFYCLNIWITQHPHTLEQKECLLEVLEIVELGISGSKSRQEQEVMHKEEKQLKAVSLRVKEAAEATLNCVMQASGGFPLAGSVLDETHAHTDTHSKGQVKNKRLRYFAVAGSVILSMLEPEPGKACVCVGSCVCVGPGVAVAIRGASGCHSWTLQQHLQPRDARTHTTQQTVSPVFSATQVHPEIRSPAVEFRQFPEHLESVPLVRVDLSIPPLEHMETRQVDMLRSALIRQQQVESRPQLIGRCVAVTKPRPTPASSVLQTARGFLSHLGLLSPETVRQDPSSGVPAQLVSLDWSVPGFHDDLKRLDRISPRNTNSALVFYMRAGQKTADEILSNVESKSRVSPHFLSFLSSLGRPVEAGLKQETEFLAVLGQSGGSVFNGERFVLKHTDALTETTFILPSTHTASDWWKTAEEDSHMLIVWMERFDDIESFPLTELLPEKKTVFILPLSSGLYAIRFHDNTNKLNTVLPLVDGSVVSQRILGVCVRECVSNCVYSDSHTHTHVSRKHVISDIIHKHQQQGAEHAFYTKLFMEP